MTAAADELRRFALQLHGWGARVVAMAPGKKPLHPWAKQDEPQTREEVEGLPWARATAVAVVCGPGGWRCFDVDALKGPAGRPVGGDARRLLLEGLGLLPDYQWAQTTPRGGLHVFFRCDEPRPDALGAGTVSVGQPVDGLAFAQLELRWAGCLATVMGPGYAWPGSGHPFVAPARLPVERVAAAFHAIARPAQGKPDEGETPRLTIPQTNVNGHYGQAALVDAMRQVATAGEGTRNAILFRQAAGLLELANGGELAAVEVERGLLAAGLTAGLERVEVEATLRSAGETVKGKARAAPSANGSGHGVNGSGPGPDGVEQVKLIAADPLLALRPQPLADLLAADMAPLEWIVADLLGRGQLAMLAGNPKSGKTWFAIQMAQAVDGGREFLGRETPRGRVLLVTLEDGPRRLRGRVEKLGWRPAGADILYEIARLDGDGLHAGPGLVQLEALAPNYDLIVIDTLIAGLSGRADENSNTAMGSIANDLAAIARRSNAAICLLHHTSKGTSDDIFHTIRGASALRGAYDVGMLLERRKGEREALLHVEGKDIEGGSFTIRQQDNGAGWQLLGSSAELHKLRAGRKVVVALQQYGDGVTVEDLAQTMGVTRQAVGQQLRAAEEHGLVKRERQKPAQGTLLGEGKPLRKEADLWFLM